MSKTSKAGKPETTTKAKSAKPAAKTARAKAAGESKTASAAADFVGRVERIHAKSGPAGADFTFALHGRKGAHQSFRLRPEHGAAMIALAHLVIAAHDKGAKIGVRSETDGEGLPFAAEIIWRPKRAKTG